AVRRSAMDASTTSNFDMFILRASTDVGVFLPRLASIRSRRAAESVAPGLDAGSTSSRMAVEMGSRCSSSSRSQGSGDMPRRVNDLRGLAEVSRVLLLGAVQKHPG